MKFSKPAACRRNRRSGAAREGRTRNPGSLIKTNTDYHEKDVLDKQVLMRIKQNLGGT